MHGQTSTSSLEFETNLLQEINSSPILKMKNCSHKHKLTIIW